MRLDEAKTQYDIATGDNHDTNVVDKKRQTVAKSVKGRVTHAELEDREEKVARLKAFLKATSPEFTARVAEAKQHLVTVESGVLAGPVKRLR